MGKHQSKVERQDGTPADSYAQLGVGALATEVLEAAQSRKPRGEPRRSLEGSFSKGTAGLELAPTRLAVQQFRLES